MQHEFCPSTGYCTKCGVLKGWHAVECLATPNVTGFMHHLAKRRMGAESAAHGLDYVPKAPTDLARLGHWLEKNENRVVVEGFPKPPPESA